MLYWFFVKGLGPIAIHRLGPTAQGLENIPHEGGAIIAANHLAVIDDALLPLTCPRMIHFMGKAEYFEGKGIKGKFKKWWFTSVGVFPVDRSGVGFDSWFDFRFVCAGRRRWPHRAA